MVLEVMFLWLAVIFFYYLHYSTLDMIERTESDVQSCEKVSQDLLNDSGDSPTIPQSQLVGFYGMVSEARRIVKYPLKLFKFFTGFMLSLFSVLASLLSTLIVCKALIIFGSNVVLDLIPFV